MIRLDWLLAAIVIVLVTTIATTAQRTTPNPQAARPQQGDAELLRTGEKLTEMVCSTSCHGLDVVHTERRTARGWSDVMTDMAVRGAIATDDEFATVKRYLTRSFGIVSINTAPAAELSAVLGLSSKDAAAIVEYRKVHGNFADLAALSRVEGIDKAKIAAQPDAFVFK